MLPGVVLAALWLVVFFLAMAESALTYASRAKLEETIQRPATRNRYFRYLERSGPATAVCVLGRVVAVAAIVTILVTNAPRSGILVLAQAAIGAGLAIVAEMTGRFIGKKWSATTLLVLLPPLQPLSLLIEPLYLFTKRLRANSSGAPDEEVVDAAKEEIRVAVEDAASEGAIHTDEKEMIKGVLEFRDSEVHEIMTPRTEMECIEIETPMPEAIRAIQGLAHSRVPVIEGMRDKVAGIVHVKDLLPLTGSGGAQQTTLRDVMRAPFFVPETKGVRSLLRDFKQRHTQIAIILDEYGGVTGLVTIEDIMEEIVGEIEDEFDREGQENRVRIVGPGAIDVDARLPVDEVNALLDIALPEDEDYDTVAGFVVERFASVPQKGQELRHDGVLIRVLESDNQRVRRVLIRKLEPEAEDSR